MIVPVTNSLSLCWCWRQGRAGDVVFRRAVHAGYSDQLPLATEVPGHRCYSHKGWFEAFRLRDIGTLKREKDTQASINILMEQYWHTHLLMYKLKVIHEQSLQVWNISRYNIPLFGGSCPCLCETPDQCNLDSVQLIESGNCWTPCNFSCGRAVLLLVFPAV